MGLPQRTYDRAIEFITSPNSETPTRVLASGGHGGEQMEAITIMMRMLL
jgi:hypothetical protein